MAIGPTEHGRGEAADTAEKGAQVVELRRQGLSFTAIGKQFDHTRQWAHQLYWQTVHAIPVQAVEDHRAEQVEVLTEVIRTSEEVRNRDHVAHSNGRVVLDANGEPVLDDAPKLDANRTIVAASARLAKLLGLDAAVKVETDGTVRYELVGVDPADLT